MDMREWINKRGGLAAGVLLVVAAVVLFTVMRSSGSAGKPPQPTAYYYNLETNTLITAAQTELPPIMDGKGVLAIVYSCSDCADKSSHIVGRLEKYTDDAKQSLRKPPTAGPGDASAGDRTRALTQGLLVADAPSPGKDIQWQPRSSSAGQTIIQGMQGKCSGAAPKLCVPAE